MKCFDDNVLSFENGLKEIEMNSVKPLQIKDETTGEIDAEYFNYRVILPKDLVCEHCVLQVNSLTFLKLCIDFLLNKI